MSSRERTTKQAARMAKNKRQKKSKGSRERGGSASPSGDGSGAEGKEDHQGRDGKGGNVLWEWTKSLLVAVVLFLFIRSFLVHTFVIISGSMEDTLLVGDLLLVNRAAVGSRIPGTSIEIPGYSELERGDILVFDPPHEEDLKLVKRLMGLPGDTLEMRSKALFVNGVPLEEPYVRHVEGQNGDNTYPWMVWQEDHLLPGADPGSYHPTRDNWGPIVIPEDRYFMLGDNRDTSLDSRYWGLLEGWRLEGRAILVYFSFNKDSVRPFPWLREIRWGRIGDLVR
ncbi:signal peptidase I [Gemmatimonadota bacterium]